MNRVKLTSSLVLLLFIISAFAGAGISPVSAGSNIVTDASTFFSTYAYVYALNSSTISADNSTYLSSLLPSWTVNTTAEYGQATFYAKSNSFGYAVLEFMVPESFGGLTVESYNGTAWNVMDGAAGYNLSVPCFWNSSDIFNYSAYSSGPPSDWAGTGAPAFVNASGLGGTLRRVQLAISTSSAVELRITLRYLTAPASAVCDGKNDYINCGTNVNVNTLNVTVVVRTFTILAGSVLISRHADSAYGWTLKHGDSAGHLVYGISSDGSAWSTATVTSPTILTNGSWQTFTLISNGTYKYAVIDGVEDVPSTQTAVNNPANKACEIGYAMISGSLYYPGIFKDVEVQNSTGYVLFINATSYNSTSGLFEDFSGSNNDGTPHGNVQYKCYTGSGFLATITESNAPTYSSIGHSTTVAGASCTFSVHLADDFQLASYIFSTNSSGVWVNDSAVSISGTSAWANVTKTLNSTAGTKIGYLWYFDDAAGNTNDTGIQTLTTTAGTTTINSVTTPSASVPVTFVYPFIPVTYTINITDTANYDKLQNIYLQLQLSDGSGKSFYLRWVSGSGFSEFSDPYDLCTINTSACIITQSGNFTSATFAFGVAMRAFSSNYTSTASCNGSTYTALAGDPVAFAVSPSAVWNVGAYNTNVSFSFPLSCTSFTFDAANNTQWTWYGVPHWSSFTIYPQNANVTITSFYTNALLTFTAYNLSSALSTIIITTAGHQPYSVTKDSAQLGKIIIPAATEGFYFVGDSTVITLSPVPDGSAYVVMNYQSESVKNYAYASLIIMSISVWVFTLAALMLLVLKMGEGAGPVVLYLLLSVIVLSIIFPIMVQILRGVP